MNILSKRVTKYWLLAIIIAGILIGSIVAASIPPNKYAVPQKGGIQTPTYSVSFSIVTGGSSTISPTGTQSYTAGQIVPITAAPASGYTFAGWTTSSSSITFDSASSASTNAHINGAGTITATFSTLSVAITIDGASWTNGTTIDWGSNLVPGQAATKPITLTNTGTIPITAISISDDAASPLPTGWTETISSLTGTLAPSATATGVITLTPASNAVPGSYSWTSYIITQP